MATDDLSAPLGQDKKKAKRRFQIPVAIPQVIAGLLGLFILTFAGWALVGNDPLGGEPMVVAANPPPKVETAVVVAAKPQAPRTPDAAVQAPATAPGTQTVTIIDGSTGKRQEVPIAARPDRPRTEQNLVETTRHGPIPKVGADGLRPAEAHAQAVKTVPGKPEGPRIAILVGGLGISSTATQSAMTKLPGPVTFAFGPYGFEVDRLVARARAGNHEVLLELPMEPFDYPDNDPGPQTLLVSLTAEQNIDRLHWLMSRFQGYVGLTNFMGARFTASEPALTPVLKEAAKRGLIYVDDGSSQRSLAGQIASANNLPFAKAEVVIDAVPTAAAIDRALSRLEALAKERGIAVGMTSALPAAIDRIAQWAKSAEGRGFVLVPISAVAMKPKPS